jgi:hypothetical protein
MVMVTDELKELINSNKQWSNTVLAGPLGDVDPVLHNVAKVISGYEHPLFPPYWFDKPIVLLFNREFVNDISGVIQTLMDKGVKVRLGILKPETQMVEPYESLSYDSDIPPLPKSISLTELYKRRTLGKCQVWEPSTFIYDVIDNLYTLWLKLATKEERTKFLFKILQGISTSRIKFKVVLDSKGTIHITGGTLADYPSKTLKINLLDDGSGQIEGLVTRTTNAQVWLGQSYNQQHHTVVQGGFLLTLLLMNLMNNLSSASVEAVALKLTSLWKAEENYGAKALPDSTDASILSSVVKPLVPTVGKPDTNFPGVRFENIGDSSPTGDHSSSELMEYFLRRGIPVVPHKYVSYDQYLIAGKGAEVMGVGLRVEPEYLKEHPDATRLNTPLEHLQVLSNNADPKSIEGAKLFNRPTGNNKAITAEGTLRHPLVASHLIMGTSEGDAYLYGIEVPVVYTNSRLGHGSGVACYNPEKEPLSYSITKRIQGQIPSYLIPAPELNTLKNLLQGTGNSVLTKLAPFVRKKLEKIVEAGTIFGPNQTVLSVWDNYPDYKTTVVQTPDVNLHFRLKELDDNSIRVVEDNKSRGNILLSLTTESVVEDDYQLKLRAPGIKCTTITDPIIFEDGRDWTLFLPYEALKGRLMQIYLFANYLFESQGVETRYISNEGILVFEKPIEYKGNTYTTVDLTLEGQTGDNVFEQWVKDNTELVWVQRYVSKHVIERLYKEEPHLIQLLNEDNPLADIQLLEEVENGYLVRELIQALSGTAHVRVEVTSPREYLTKQGITIEQLASLESVSPELALAINDSAKPVHQGIKSFLDFCNNKLPTEGIQEYTLPQLKECLSTYLSTEGILFRKSSDILFLCEDLFPSGMYLIDKNGVKTYIHFGLLIKYGSISNAGTTLTGLADNIVDLLRRLLANDVTPDAENLYASICALIKLDTVKWVGQMQGQTKGESKVVAGLGKTANIWTGLKIKTSHLPELEHIDDLPVYIFHPECESIRRLRLKQGDYLAVGRNPMGSLSFGIAIIDRNIGHVGHVMCSPETWAIATQGDSDGDVANLLNISKLITSRTYNTETKRFNVTHFQTSKEELCLWNQSVLMMGGSDDSFSGFVSGKSKWTSKLIDVDKALDGYIPNALSPVVTVLPALTYVGTGKKVSEHYTFNVGNGYGIYSVLCFWCTNMTAAIRKDILKGWSDYDGSKIQDVTKLHQLILENEAINHVQKALMVACRMIYEDLGLGGYTPFRASVFEVISASTNAEQYNHMIAKVYLPSGPKYVSMRELPLYMEDYKYEEVEGRRLLSTMLFNNTNPDSIEVVKVLLEANQLRLIFSSVENGTRRVPYTPWGLNTEERACIYGALRRIGKGNYNRGLDGLSTYEVVGSLMGTTPYEDFIKSDILKYYLGNVPTMLNLFQSYKQRMRPPQGF